VPHDDRHVSEEEVVLLPPEPGDLVADLVGALRLVAERGNF